MKFLADMGISARTIIFLRNLGYDSLHLREEQLQRAEDKIVLQKAYNEGRILLTHDLDFGELIAASGARLPSVIIFRLRDMRPDCVNHHLQRVILDRNDFLEQGAILSVNEKRVRVRILPIQ